MGVIIKQTFKGAIYSYLGVILGGINVAILFPIIFSEEEIGLINILITVSAIAAQFASLGSAGIIVYFFPQFRNRKNAHNSFFIFVSLFASIGFLLFTVLFYFWGDLFLITKEVDTHLQQQYYPLLFPLTFFTLAFIVVDMFSASTFNSAIGNLYKDVVVRVGILVLSILYLYHYISFNTFMLLYTLNLAIPVVALLFFMVKKGDINFQWPKLSVYATHLKKITSVGLFYILSGLSEILASYIDKYMISYYLGLKATGVYSITNYFGALTRIPRSSMGKIGTPVIAGLLNQQNYKELSVLLKKSSLSQILMGAFIFVNIWINIDLILGFLPPSYAEGKWVVFFISISHLFYCFMGLGAVTLSVSQYYKVGTYLAIALGIMVLALNLLLIPQWGINGAAISTAIAKFVYVVLTLAFIAYKLKIKVLFFDSLKIVVSSFFAWYLISYLPTIEYDMHEYLNLIFNLALRSGTVSLAFVFFLFLTRFIRSIKQIKSMF
ncbi:Membrane protein involved in the export of O-antigen and teichoic acid [Saccharicrinis carchari]|uniref:Membrane protein involved in the export of O-antigen and teichoic acid n=1 Tax=Saccharicrinis carchari TaxID=1168039 RepID=A0A521CRZ3_SACCC|nr:lipopolysaccharide biosynthesis protein [Saccharicrinis carchari]SMO62249.1 Membrane protein involved in the export of O-antigen and teichoic acid [Saccharicrinis carchari]